MASGSVRVVEWVHYCDPAVATNLCKCAGQCVCVCVTQAGCDPAGLCPVDMWLRRKKRKKENDHPGYGQLTFDAAG